MHRSGTSLLAEILGSLGLFTGSRLNALHEAVFFTKINDWILLSTGGSWAYPETIHTLLNHSQARPLVSDYLHFLLTAPRVMNYMGLKNYLRFRTPARLEMPWGWKDPRNTYTLPLWLELLPDARVIHIYRNGIDVAQSLAVRNQSIAQKLTRWRSSPWNSRYWKYRLQEDVHPRPAFGYLTLEFGFELWEQYTRTADQHIASLPPEQTRTICYETFLQDPLPALRDLCHFAGLTPGEDQLAAACATINPARSNAYQQDETLRAFYDQVKNSAQMIRYGYSDGT